MIFSAIKGLHLSRRVLFMTTIRRLLKKMPSLSHQKRKLKRCLKSMQMFIKAPITTNTTTRKKIINNNRLFSHERDNDEFRRTTPSRRPFTTRYQNLFLGYCFSCRNFSYKEIHCKAYGINVYISKIYYENYKDDLVNNKTRSIHAPHDRI